MNAGVPKWQLYDSQLTQTWSNWVQLPPFTLRIKPLRFGNFILPCYYHWHFQPPCTREEEVLSFTKFKDVKRVFLLEVSKQVFQLSGFEFSFSKRPITNLIQTKEYRGPTDLCPDSTLFGSEDDHEPSSNQ